MNSGLKIFYLALIGGIASWIYQSLQTFHGTYDAATLQRKYGPWTVVIGASEGLGAAWADLLCSQGLHVVTMARREDALNERKKELQSKYSCQVDVVKVDLAEPEEASEVFDKVLCERDVGLVVYNAALFNNGDFLSSLDYQIKGIKINVESVARAAYSFGSHIQGSTRNSSGLIIMSSSLGDTGSGYVATYGATKAFDTILAQSLGGEFKHMGMDVLACVAGPISTPNFHRANNDTSGMEFLIQQPEEVASECLYGLGQGKYAVATGPYTKLMRFVTKRLLPTKLTIDAMSQNMRQSLGAVSN